MRPFHMLTVLLLAASAQAQVAKPPANTHGKPRSQDKTGVKPKHVNRLAKETSPYLLSHKNNPVDWYAWGKEAIAKAKKEDKAIFLSIGYSACHWCHVMERESFENEEIAALMNKYFVCIKVDREERPDLDEIYMSAVQRMTGSGGWPMSVFLTPELKPFFGGTYFPPEDKYGRAGFKRILEGLGGAWKTKRDLIDRDADKMATYLRQTLSPPSQKGKLTTDFIKTAAAMSANRWDKDHGGFGQAPRFAPKFPHPSELSVLLLNSARSQDKTSLQIAEQTLEKMRRGGMYDQVGDGFHRYSTDRLWLVPHFEKMLYDNTLLVQTYLDAYLHTGKAFYKGVAADTLDYLLREMQHEKGGFYSTTDADSEGVEGKFFVWTKMELDTALGPDAALFDAVYGVTDKGNWHEMPGQTVLSVVLTAAEAAKKFELTEAEVEKRLATARKVLYEIRKKRVPPQTDDKVLSSWNGMAICAMAQGFKVLGEERYLRGAQRAANFVLTEMRDENGRLFRSWRNGEARLNGYLVDYAYTADALFHLFEADFDPRWLRAGKELLGMMMKHFHDPLDGNFFFTADDHEELIARSKSVTESSSPSGTAMATLAFIRGGLLLADEKLVEVGRSALEANHSYLDRYPTAVLTMLQACDLLLHDPREVVIAGELDDAGTQAFLQRLRGTWPNTHVVTVLHSGNAKELGKLVKAHEGKVPRDGKAAAYVCKFGVCEAPVTNPDAMKLK